ncbi:PARP7S [Mytilus edulis]|uniref:PARP7S n=1 Tax=Mytilus edulis TaxID=6550 RepID=A0A8S3S4R9_MYTED|nr:PARP7S [Mytilus edulis]
MTTIQKKEEINIIRILIVIHKHVTVIQRQLIDHHLTKLSLSFTQLLNKYGHELYHLCYIKYRCCQCGPIDILPNQQVLTTKDYTFLFEKDSSSRIAGHISKPSRKCCNFAKSNVSPNDLDFSLLTKVLLHCCQDLFWQCCLEEKGVTLEQFLNDNKHKIYHMWKTYIPCSLCENGKVPRPKSLCLSEYNWNCLFVSTTTPSYPSSFTAKSGIMVSQLDPELAYKLMSTFCDVIDAIELLRQFRNRFAHPTDFQVKTCEFEKIWSAIEKAVLLIADVYGQRKEVQCELSNVGSPYLDLSIEKLASTIQALQTNNDIQEQRVYYLHQVVSNMQTGFEREIREMNRTFRQFTYEKGNEVQVKATLAAEESTTTIVSSIVNSLKGLPRRINLSFVNLKDSFSDVIKRNFIGSDNSDFTRNLVDVESGIMTDQISPYRYLCDENEQQSSDDDTSENGHRSLKEDLSDSDDGDGDLLRCGNCGEEFKSLKRFKYHKKSHMIKDRDLRRQKDINATLTIKGLPRNIEEEIVKYSDKIRSIRTRDRSTAEIKIIDETLGSLIIWTKISVAVFKSKDLFLRALKEFLDKTFSYFPLEDGNDIDMTVSIQIDEEELDVDDMGDFFRCGICSKEFYALAAFEYHKKNVCGRGASRDNQNLSLQTSDRKSKSRKTTKNNAQRDTNNLTDNRDSNAANSRYGLPKVSSIIQPLRNRLDEERWQMYQHADTKVDTSDPSFNDQLQSRQQVARFEDNVTCEELSTIMVSHATTETRNSQHKELQSENYVQRRADEKFCIAKHKQVEEDVSIDDKCDVNITGVTVKDVLKFLIRTFGGGCSFDEFMRRCNLFPMDANICGWFEKHKNSFNIFWDEEDILFIQPYYPNIQTCAQWNIKKSPGKCDNLGCQGFHICMRFVKDICRDTNCHLSHTFSSQHNLHLKDKLGISDFSENDIKVILNCASPSLCVDYMYTSGCKVVDSEKRCPQLHLCEHKLRGDCTNPCKFNKSHSTEDLHNKWVLKSCHMDEWPEDLVFQAIQMPSGDDIDDDERSNSSDYSQDEPDTYDVDANTRENKTYTDFKYGLQHDSFKIGPDLSQDEGDIDDADDYTFDSSFHRKEYSEETAPSQPKDSDLLHGESDTDNESVSSVDRLLGFKGRQSPVSIRDDMKRSALSQDELAIGENFDSSNNDELNEQLAIALSIDDNSYDSMFGLDAETRTIDDDKDTKKLHHRFYMTEKSKNILQSTISDFLDLPETETKSSQSDSAHDKESLSTPLKQEQHKLISPANVSDSSVKPTPKSPYVDPSRPYYQERRLYLVKDQSDKTKICEFVTKDKCTRRYCRYHHIPSGMPYLWQINMYGRWLSFAVAENETIEKAFCDLQGIFATTVKYYRNKYSCHVRFNQMYAIIYEVEGQAADNEEPCKIRRLTTASFIERDPNVSSFPTNWRWYWKNDENQWINYERDAFLFTLEKKYLTEQKTYIFFRENFTSKFKIDFQKMTQVNLDTGKVRDIIRRPLFVSRYDVQQDKFPENIPIPTVMNAPKPQHFYSWDYSNDFEFVELDTKEEEYREVFNSLQESMSTPRFEFSIIYRIQNRKLWSEFETKKKLMLADVEQDGRSRDIGERHLFHGTDSLETCYGICTNNFDFRTSGRNATMYGQGSYFAVHAEYSHSYTKANTSSDNRIMFRSKVLVGQFTKGDPSLRRPPEIPGKFHKLYDSCVDDVHNPQIFVVFDRNQCYPEYLIMYKDRETTSTTSGHSMTYPLSEETVSSLQEQEGNSREGLTFPESKSALGKSKTALRKPKSVSKHL